jgi:uncharacterized protein YaiI (UPF0178 family)
MEGSMQNEIAIASLLDTTTIKVTLGIALAAICLVFGGCSWQMKGEYFGKTGIRDVSDSRLASEEKQAQYNKQHANDPLD